MPRVIVSTAVKLLTTAGRCWLPSVLSCTAQLAVACWLPTSALPVSASEPAELPSKSVLRWSSGDQLAGQIIDANPQALRWDADLFAEPLQLRLEALRSITWQYDQPSKLARRGFRVETAQGNLLVGDLIGCDQETVRLETTSFGVLEIPRENVRSMVNLAGSAGRWLGPMSIEEWDADRQSKQGLLDTAQGQVVFTRENLVFKKFAVKQKTLIDVAFRWTGALDMKFGFAVPKKWANLDAPVTNKEVTNKEDVKSEAPDTSKGSSMVVMKIDPGVLEQLPRLEMFSDAMVVQQKDVFDIVLEEVDLASGFLRLAFEWDPQANQLKAFDASGKLLATIALNPLTDDFEPGIFVLNQNGRFTLDNLVVMTLPEELNPMQAVIATKQGTVAGTVEGFDGQTWSIRRASDQTLVQVAKDDFHMAHVAAVTERTAASDQVAENSKSITKLELRDGSRVAGALQSIADSSLKLRSDIASQPVTVRLDRAQRLDFTKLAAEQADAEQIDKGTHLLETAEGQCHGWLSHEGEANGLLWKPVGCDQAVSLLGGGFRIHGTDPTTIKALESIESVPPKNPNGYRDQLYLRNGDRFPANVVRVQSGQVYAEAFQRETTFPTGEVVRCLLGVPNTDQSTLDNPPWQVTKVDEKPQPEAMASGLVFNRYACHPSLLETGGFAVTVRGGMNTLKVEVGMAINTEELTSRLEFKLFASKPSDPGTPVYLSVMALPGNMVSVSLCADPILGDGMIPLSLRSADNIVCSFKVVESELIGSINGTEVYRKRLKLSPDATRGVVIGLHDKLPIDAIQQDNTYSIRNAFVRQDSREVALTEPRFVTHQPARSLLVGRNRDLWRADIVSMNDDSVTVRSGGRHLVIERSLVSSLLWPDLPPVEETPPESLPDQAGEPDQGEAAKGETGQGEAVQPEPPLVPAKPGKLTDVQLVTSDGTKLTLKLESWGDQTAVGSSPHYGRIELPVADIVELRSGSQIVEAADYEGLPWRFKLGKNLPVQEESPEGGGDQGGEEGALVGQEAPTFVIKNLDGPDIDLAAYRGKVVVLDFWATWCGYCVEELPGMVAEIAKLPQDKVQLITLDQNEETDAITSWMKEKGLNFVVGLDKDQVAPQYKVNGLPTTYVIDPAGKIVHVKVGGGEGPFQELMQVVRKLVDEAAPSTTASTTPTAAKPDRVGEDAGTPQPAPEKPAPEKPAPEKPTAEKPTQQKKALVSVAAHIQPARGDQPALLVIRAEIAEGHKIFSLTQPAGGPVKTKIKMDAPEGYKLSEFRALKEPKKFNEPSFNNMEVEVHQGIATWYAPLDVSAGVDVNSLEIKGKVNMQVCSANNCMAPRDYPFTAKLAEQDVIAPSIDENQK